MSETGDSRNQTECSGKHSFNIITEVSQFAEDHLTIVRNLSTGIAVAGLFVLARSIKLTKKFGVAAEIPAHFIEKNVRLRGKVHRVTEKGLEVEHIPITVPLLSPLLKRYQSDAVLSLRLAGVEVTEEGRVWLIEQLTPNRLVWFTLLRREGDTLHCLVSVSRSILFSTCVNEELLRLGLGRTVAVEGLHPHSHLHWKLHRRLLKAETRAQKRGKGLWKEKSLRERAWEAVYGSTLVQLLNRLLKWTSRPPGAN